MRLLQELQAPDAMEPTTEKTPSSIAEQKVLQPPPPKDTTVNSHTEENFPRPKPMQRAASRHFWGLKDSVLHDTEVIEGWDGGGGCALHPMDLLEVFT